MVPGSARGAQCLYRLQEIFKRHPKLLAALASYSHASGCLSDVFKTVCMFSLMVDSIRVLLRFGFRAGLGFRGLGLAII